MIAARARDVLAWTDPLESGLLFGIGTLAFYLLRWGGYSVLQLLSVVALALLGLCQAVAAAAWLHTRLWPTRPLPAALVPLGERFKHQEGPLTAQDAWFAEAADAVLWLANQSRTVARRGCYGAEPLAAVALAGALLGALAVGACVSGLVLLYMLFCAAFAWPRLYATHRVRIDAALARARSLLQRLEAARSKQA